MIRLEAFIDDKKVGKVLYALDGLVIQYTIAPVRNAVNKGKKVVSAGEPTTGPQVIAAQIQKALKEKKTSFTTQEAIELGRTYGVPRTSIMAAIPTAKKNKFLKNSNKRGTHIIVTAKG